jgi:hypothetical protein
MRTIPLFLMAMFFMAPDGVGGGGAPPGEIPLEDWITRLNAAGKKDRKTIVEELAGALGVKIGEAYKKLKEAGWNPKTADTQPGHSAGAEGSAAGGNRPPVPPVKTFSVFLRHRTSYPYYRRAGLLLTNQFKPYTVTAEQLEVLKKDAWVEFQKPAGPDKT